jgi:amino acid transporter
MPFGVHGVFAALTGGVVFALQGFEQAVHLAGEARDPRRDLSRSILVAMAIGAVLYALLQIVMIGGLEPANIATGWSRPLGTDPSDYGAWYTLALAVGAGWLAKLLIIDAVVSPAGTGVVYVATTARLSYALGEESEMPSALASTNEKGVPVVSILVAAIVGTLAFGPFKSWNALVSVVTGATAIMYAFAPVSLAALRLIDSGRSRSYQAPMPSLLLPAAFCAANLIIYWGGFDTTWKLGCAMLVGLVLFGVGAWRVGSNAVRTIRHSIWIGPWLGGQVLIGAIGRYGGGTSLLPNWVDILVVIGFSLAIFYWAIGSSLNDEQSAVAIAKDARQLNY